MPEEYESRGLMVFLVRLLVSCRLLAILLKSKIFRLTVRKVQNKLVTGSET